VKPSTRTPMLIAVVIAALVLLGFLATTRNLHRGIKLWHISR
jgi:hypothetical protein